MTAVTYNLKKSVSNEVKDNYVLLEPSYGKNRTEATFWPAQYEGPLKGKNLIPQIKGSRLGICVSFL